MSIHLKKVTSLSINVKTVSPIIENYITTVRYETYVRYQTLVGAPRVAE